jgi:hypothetical protein
MAKGGSTETKTTLPKFYETALQQQIGMASDVAQTGYVPYYGPDVAAFSPMQQASFQGTDMMAGAFGMPTTGGQQYMPAPTQFEGGVQGYSSAPIYQQAVDTLAANRPAQAAHLESFTINPVTGEVGSNAASQQPVALEMQGGSRRGK